jgi:hypothetical protein
MTAGIPCLGLSGLFVILTAAVTPIWRLARRDGDQIRPVRVRAVFALAAAIAAATWLSWTATAFVLGSLIGVAHHANFGTFFGVPIIVVSLLMLLGIIGVAEVAAHVLPHRATPTSPPVHRVEMPDYRAHLVPAVRRRATSSPPSRVKTSTKSVAPPNRAAVPRRAANAISLRRRELATQRARLRNAREEALTAWDQLLAQLDSNNEELRAFSRAITTLVDLQAGERTGHERVPAAGTRRQ